MLWLGRFSPDKAPHLAIEAARQAGRRIVLAGKLNEPDEKKYFHDTVKPLLGRGVEYVGEADAVMKRELLAGARALAFPIQWEEPFGMVMIEAMACGTPVVATRRGSVPEIVVHGTTGLIVDEIGDFAQALQLADDIDPAAARQHVQRHFDVPAMAAGYERIYRMLADGTSSLQRLLDAARAN